MDAIIRKYLSSDRDQCLEAFRTNVPLYFTEGEVADFERFLERIADKTDKADYYVVSYNGKIVGCGGFGDKDNRKVISLAWGLVHNNHHKKGFGKLLLLYRLEQIRKQYPELPVVVDTTQHTFGFFARLGFRTLKITNDYYAPGLHRYDMQLETEKFNNQ